MEKLATHVYAAGGARAEWFALTNSATASG
jgi:hypothetical protein